MSHTRAPPSARSARGASCAVFARTSKENEQEQQHFPSSSRSTNSTNSTAQTALPSFLPFSLFSCSFPSSSPPFLHCPCRLNPSRQRLLLLPTPHENHPLSTFKEAPTSMPLMTMLWSATTIPPFPVTPTSTPTLTPPQLPIPNDSTTNTTITITITIPIYLPAVLLLQPLNNPIAPTIHSI